MMLVVPCACATANGFYVLSELIFLLGLDDIVQPQREARRQTLASLVCAAF